MSRPESCQISERGPLALSKSCELQNLAGGALQQDLETAANYIDTAVQQKALLPAVVARPEGHVSISTGSPMKQAPRPEAPEVTGVQDLLERLRLSSEQKRAQQQQQLAGSVLHSGASKIVTTPAI